MKIRDIVVGLLALLLITVGTRPARALDIKINDNAGASATANFTQSEVSVLVFGNTVLAGFNDAGSVVGGANKFTGYARSTDGGLTFVDMGTLPTNPGGDAGDPVLARDSTSGTIYFSTLGFTTSGLQVFRSFDGGATFAAPVNGMPGRTSVDVPKITVDNFPGGGQGNVYVASRTFDISGNGIFLFRSTDGGTTFGPTGGTLVASAGAGNVHGAWVTVGPDHSVYVFWLDQASGTIRLRKSTDGGLTLGPVVTAATTQTTGVNGDLGLTGIRNGTVTSANFRSVTFPQAIVNPVTGHLYLVYTNNPAGTDKADIMLVVSSDGGATWGAPIRVNDDVTTNDQWHPTVAVTPDGSRLGIFWYDRRGDPLNNLIAYFGDICVLSAGLPTCGVDFQVSDVTFLPEFGRDFVVNSLYMGDYDIAQADNSFFYVAWGDNREPLPGGEPRMDPNVFFDKVPTGAATTPVPEPTALLMVGAGAVALARRGWSRRRSA